MPKDIHVMLIEDDIYARDLMNLMLTRDWRTRVVGELGIEDDIQLELSKQNGKIDVVVIDTEVPGDTDWGFRIIEQVHRSGHQPQVIATATKANPAILKQILQNKFSGYLLKRELRYSIATAIALAHKQNRFVITPTINRVALQERLTLPAQTSIIDGTKSFARLTHREDEIARLAILFNLAHRDLADELLIRADQVSKYVSNTYTKLGLDELLNQEFRAEAYFQDQTILKHFQKIMEKSSSTSRKKTSDMATLAFHLLTLPEVTEA